MHNDLATLIGSRICHDLISPIGAIGNGVELMELTGGGNVSAELSLISDSAASASARIRFFRVAFGAAPPGQSLTRKDVGNILNDIAVDGRLRYDWQDDGTISRADVRAVFLLLLCIETAAVHGAQVVVQSDGDDWAVTARGDRFRCDPALWRSLTQRKPVTDLTPALVQFALLPQVIADTGSHLTLSHTEKEITGRIKSV